MAPRNGYVDANDFKDFTGLLNFRPFATWTDHWLENFNIGGSTTLAWNRTHRSPRCCGPTSPRRETWQSGPSFSP